MTSEAEGLKAHQPGSFNFQLKEPGWNKPDPCEPKVSLTHTLTHTFREENPLSVVAAG